MEYGYKKYLSKDNYNLLCCLDKTQIKQLEDEMLKNYKLVDHIVAALYGENYLHREYYSEEYKDDVVKGIIEWANDYKEEWIKYIKKNKFVRKPALDILEYSYNFSKEFIEKLKLTCFN